MGCSTLRLRKIRESKKMAVVYACFSTNIIHEGHMNLIQEVGKYGKVIIGILTDEATIQFDRFPVIDFEE